MLCTCLLLWLSTAKGELTLYGDGVDDGDGDGDRVGVYLPGEGGIRFMAFP